MSRIQRLTRAFSDLSSRRSRHLMFLLHVWACAPFMVVWLRDPQVQVVIGEPAIAKLRPYVLLILAYLVGRTIVAWRDPPRLRWDWVFPPIDVALISAILFVSHRGPLSNITLLYFFPIVEAAGTLSPWWAAIIGFLVVAGTGLSTMSTDTMELAVNPQSLRDIIHQDPLNAAFRLYFLIIISSLMAYQTRIAAGYRERLGVAADRNRIAMDMHDGVQGRLITIASQLELLGLIVERDPKRAAELARESREMTRQAADELRFLVQRLRAPGLEDGFVPALRQYAHNICTRNGLEFEFAVEGRPGPRDPDAENALFRVAQEAISNVVKHAMAKNVRLVVTFQDNPNPGTKLCVSDDGVGFAHDMRPSGTGIAGMKDRMSLVGGEVFVQASESGTEVVAMVSGPSAARLAPKES
jgi:signal transduction histidine kinase